jgi:hypothetical protein
MEMKMRQPVNLQTKIWLSIVTQKGKKRRDEGNGKKGRYRRGKRKGVKKWENRMWKGKKGKARKSLIMTAHQAKGLIDARKHYVLLFLTQN